MGVDLHVHSTASDGTWTPAQVVAEAGKAGVELLALTDHDTMEGARQAIGSAGASGIRFVPGIEFNTDVPGHEIDILGYFREIPSDPAFIAILRKRDAARIERAREILKKLKSIGIDIPYDRVREIAGGVVARPHIAQAMIEKGYVGSQKEAYRRYIGLGGPAFVEHDPFQATDAISTIRNTGGIPVIAHPGLIRDDSWVEKLIEAGVQGLEVFYPEHTPEQVKHYADLARRAGLLVTAGSDNHGPGRKKSYPLGSMDLPAADRAAFLDALESDWSRHAAETPSGERRGQ